MTAESMGRAKKALAAARGFLADMLADEEDPQVPHYDPLHLAAVLIAFMASCGALYWLLWTLLVYKGGFFWKLKALVPILLGKGSFKAAGCADLSCRFGAFDGWIGNLSALLIGALVLAALDRLYWKAARREATSKKG